MGETEYCFSVYSLSTPARLVGGIEDLELGAGEGRRFSAFVPSRPAPARPEVQPAVPQLPGTPIVPTGPPPDPVLVAADHLAELDPEDLVARAMAGHVDIRLSHVETIDVRTISSVARRMALVGIEADFYID